MSILKPILMLSLANAIYSFEDKNDKMKIEKFKILAYEGNNYQHSSHRRPISVKEYQGLLTAAFKYANRSVIKLSLKFRPLGDQRFQNSEILTLFIPFDRNDKAYNNSVVKYS